MVKKIKNLKHEYTDEIFNEKILIIGLYPPPMGGISIHIKRIEKKLIAQKNEVICIDTVKELKTNNKRHYIFKLFSIIKKNQPSIIYYHSLILWKVPLDLLLFIFLKPFFNFKLVLIDHTPRFFFKKNYLYKKIINLFFAFLDKQILIGDSTYDSYIKNKIFLKNYSIESPFLPPDIDEENEILSFYPKSLFNFLTSYQHIILLNASGFKLYDGLDLYGFDFAIRLINDLNDKQYGLILASGSITDYNYFKKIENIIECQKNIYLLLECKQELWPLIKRSKIFIRPTCSDAFGISVQEAIYFNVPTVASDVCYRPEGTILFKSRNYDDFYNKVKSIVKY